ncbi:hypothetical protein CSUB8523_0860 [Campylobacter subantarcticus LMG 24377]|uniref:Ferrochelatase n=2 Tax=Campylobacter subantarcticus TaxID=497724 RepID=A0A0A8H9H9_9BACT|nr:hypothetical protein [Campylobacter subantarcticus]EAJ1260696.1 hypothetical protein [Campylobacter lari]AJC90622.1 hypothetical protein CSUB8521_0773 [Campylobacter subantarcticus LMG 24374]AJC92382.1 hypothetical protein CSUB8523_0860 [Campylobacter subantarcticus LMG 24377]EAL3938605.1 hypothetical protein [Campylobacter lari]MPB99559.1 hypothetical protein [Campylobacter subantarcticus]
MNISNFCELINAQVANYGATSSVYDFSIDLNKVKQASAFFAKNQEQASYAIKLGAYVIVSEERLKLEDEDVFYLQVDDLEEAILRLFRFLCEEKSCEFVYCDDVGLKFAKAFNFKILSSNVLVDFENLKNAKERTFFCSSNEQFILKLKSNFHTLKTCDYEILGAKSLFQTSILCKKLYFKDLKFAFFYADIFASFIDLIENQKLSFHFNEKKLELFDAYFLNSQNQICSFGGSSRVILLVENEKDFEFIAQKLQGFKGFKTALKNSLLCDFSYTSLEELKKFFDFKYCLIKENKEDFLEYFLYKEKNISLFD